VRADQYSHGDDEIFEIHFISPLVVAFRSAHSKWLCAEPSGYMVCDRSNRSDWEAFHLCVAAQGKFAFKAYNAKFLTSLQDGYLSANSVAIGEWEMYDLQLLDLEDRQISLVGFHGKYISADTATGKVFASLNKRSKSEIFSMKVISYTQVAFKGPNGKWIAADSQGHVTCSHDTMTDRAIFFIHPAPDNHYSFRSSSGLFLCSEAGTPSPSLLSSLQSLHLLPLSLSPSLTLPPPSLPPSLLPPSPPYLSPPSLSPPCLASPSPLPLLTT